MEVFVKKITALLLLVALSVTMAFAEGQQENGDMTVLTIPHYRSGKNVGAKFFLAQIDRFNQKYAGKYKIVIEQIPNDDYFPKMKQLAQQNKLPALVEEADNNWFRDIIIPNEMSYDLSGWIKAHPDVKKVLIREQLDYVTQPDGTVVGLPKFKVSPMGMFYNSELYNPPKPISEMTIDEFGESLGDNKIAFMTAENAWTVSLFFSAIVAEEGGNELVKIGQFTPLVDYTSEVWVRSFDRLQKFIQKYGSDNTVGAAYADAANSFMSKKSAVIPNGPWMIGDFQESSADKWSNGFDGDSVVACFFPGNYALGDDLSYGWWIPSSTPEKEREAALAYLEFIYTPEEIEASIIADGGFCPGLKTSESFNTELAKHKMLSQMNDALNEKTVFIQRATTAMPHSVSEAEFGKLLPKLIDGSLTARQFAEELSRKASQAMN